MKYAKKYVTTPDNFYGNFSGNTVEIILDLSKKPFTVFANGNDDYGMCYSNEKRYRCREVYNKIKDGITKKRLQELGFKDYN